MTQCTQTVSACLNYAQCLPEVNHIHLHYWQSKVPTCHGIKGHDQQCKPSHRTHMEVSNQLHIYSTPEKEFPVTNNLKSGWIIQNKVVCKVGPVHTLKTYKGKRGQISLAHVGIRWRWSPSYPSHFPPNEIIPQYPLNRMLVLPQSPTGPSGEAKHLLSLPGSEPWIVQLVTMPVMTPCFCYRYRRKEKYQCCYQQSVQLPCNWDQRRVAHTCCRVC